MEASSPVIVSINLGNFGSTGVIAAGIAACAEKAGYRCYTAFPHERGNRKPYGPRDILIGDSFTRKVWARLSRLIGFNGCYNYTATLLFLRRLRKLRPDLLHLHNLHNCYINLPMLFAFIKKHNIPVVWTLHDCWSFTGQCPHFSLAGCEKWKTGCHDCKQFRAYPECVYDNTKTMYRLKRKWFTNVQDLTIVTPSAWLAGLVRQSYLRDYPVRVIHNGIDLAVFRPTQGDFRAKHDLAGKFLLLGVSFQWDDKKGLDVWIELAKRLGDRYQIALAGTNDTVDAILPPGVLSIHRTQNREELAALYTAADLFVNASREENYPTVNMEALACGTPVLTFDAGGSGEIADAACGMAVPVGDIDALEAGVRDICQNRRFSEAACLARAQAFAKEARNAEYAALYHEILKNGEARQ